MIDYLNLPRWIFASINKHFLQSTSGVITFTEGTDRDPEADVKDHAEFRMDGPRYTQWSVDYFHIWVAVNILFQSVMDDEDTHRKFVTVGLITNGFVKSIPIYKYGDGPSDDDTYIGCMSLIQDKNNKLQVNHFGQVDTEYRLEQGTVEGHYEMFLTG